ncbi:MAG: 1-acyl-sn-glycerol-3-phosphate acyltransferase [Leptolyngbyaceae cyanobacterium T60_A2020_046]|nr:1-acyl-sn-glycerol-3-phosphate acyltransferase [Leptolyngbyaceae cyanobacterium T60_A2020_046]
MVSKLTLSMPRAHFGPVPIPTYQPTTSRCSPWLTPLAYFLGRYLVLPFYFQHISVLGQENLPHSGPVILAPTHRARWDSIILPLAAGRVETGRDLRYMVTSDEVKGIQGWFIRRLGGFPVNVRSPSISSLRHGIDLLQQGEMLVIFPEGGIFRDRVVHRLKPGLARLAVQAEALPPALGVKVVPVSIHYTSPYPRWRDRVTVKIGTPLEVSHYLQAGTNSDRLKASAKQLTEDLSTALKALSGEAIPSSPETVDSGDEG